MVPSRAALQLLLVRTGAAGAGGAAGVGAPPAPNPQYSGFPGPHGPQHLAVPHWLPCPPPGPLQRPLCPTCKSPQLGPSRRVVWAREDHTGLRADPRSPAPANVAPAPKALEAPPTRCQPSSWAPAPQWPAPAGTTERQAQRCRVLPAAAGAVPLGPHLEERGGVEQGPIPPQADDEIDLVGNVVVVFSEGAEPLLHWPEAVIAHDGRVFQNLLLHVHDHAVLLEGRPARQPHAARTVRVVVGTGLCLAANCCPNRPLPGRDDGRCLAGSLLTSLVLELDTRKPGQEASPVSPPASDGTGPRAAPPHPCSPASGTHKAP